MYFTCCTNKTFDKDIIYIIPEKNQQIHNYINKKYQVCAVHYEKKKRITEDGNLDVANQIIH